jgi:hypothetical protein
MKTRAHYPVTGFGRRFVFGEISHMIVAQNLPVPRWLEFLEQTEPTMYIDVDTAGDLEKWSTALKLTDSSHLTRPMAFGFWLGWSVVVTAYTPTPGPPPAEAATTNPEPVPEHLGSCEKCGADLVAELVDTTISGDWRTVVPGKLDCPRCSAAPSGVTVTGTDHIRDAEHYQSAPHLSVDEDGYYVAIKCGDYRCCQP